MYMYPFYVTVNIVTLILFIHLSVRLSRPLTSYWEEFLLSYRN